MSNFGLKHANKISFFLIKKSKPIKYQIISIILISSILVWLSEVNNVTLYLIEFLVERMIALLAGLIGFFLTSLVLLLSIPIHNTLYKAKSDGEYSAFSKALAWYTTTLEISIITIIISFLVFIIYQLKIETNPNLAEIINKFVLWIIINFSFYSLFSTLNLLASIYNFGLAVVISKNIETLMKK